MGAERHVKLFRDGPVQTVHIPAEFQLPGDDAVIRQEGDRLVLEPVKQKDFFEWLATIEPWNEDFPDVDGDLPALRDVEL